MSKQSLEKKYLGRMLELLEACRSLAQQAVETPSDEERLAIDGKAQIMVAEYNHLAELLIQVRSTRENAEQSASFKAALENIAMH